MNTYRMPAEFEPHLGCILHYPHLSAVWRGVDGDCCYGRYAFREVARAISQHGNEDVHMFCTSEEDASQLRIDIHEKGEVTGIHVHVAKSDDSWCRDIGPTFVFNSSGRSTAPSLAGVNWDFNAYGGPDEGGYWQCENDKVLAQLMTDTLSQHYQLQRKMYSLPRKDIIIEGGSFHTDGEGTILTTEECLLNKNRNPNLTKSQIEEKLKSQLGAKKVIWLKRGLYNDTDTSGHVDNIACFISPGHVGLAWSDDETDPQYEISRECKQTLLNTTDACGRKLTIHKLVCPQPLFYTKEEVDTLTPRSDVPPRVVGDRMAASYVNFYIANNAVILPGFGQKESDENAKEVLQKLFPNRAVVLIYSREINLGGGNIHCITQQIPDPDSATALKSNR